MHVTDIKISILSSNNLFILSTNNYKMKYKDYLINQLQDIIKLLEKSKINYTTVFRKISELRRELNTHINQGHDPDFVKDNQ